MRPRCDLDDLDGVWFPDPQADRPDRHSQRLAPVNASLAGSGPRPIGSNGPHLSGDCRSDPEGEITRMSRIRQNDVTFA